MKGPTEVSLRVSVRMQIHIGYLFTLRSFTHTEEIPSEILQHTRQRLPKLISQCAHTHSGKETPSNSLPWERTC